jgi:dolichol-phosphate mannosyltransferase
MSNVMNADCRNSLDCSIIIPVYFNEHSIEPTLSLIEREVIARNQDRSFEVIFVDDGSGDGSLDVLLQTQRRKPQLVRVIQLTRNFGQVGALLAGFSLARGKCVIPISADMQDPPQLMNDMLQAFFAEGYEVVICQRAGRDESWYRVMTSRIFYWLMRRLCFPNMPLGGFDYVLLGRRSRDLLLRQREAHPFLQGQILWPGFRTKYLEYHRQERSHGKSRWTFWKKLTYLVDGVTGYSFFPIRCMSVTGIVVAMLGLLYAAVVFAARLFGGVPFQGWAPLMIVILVLGGFQLLTLGIIGEYVWRGLAQARCRDPYVIEAIHGGGPAQADELICNRTTTAKELDHA